MDVGVGCLVQFEQAGYGITINTMSVMSDNYSFITAIGMLVFDIFLWSFLWIVFMAIMGDIESPYEYLKTTFFNKSKIHNDGNYIQGKDFVKTNPEYDENSAYFESANEQRRNLESTNQVVQVMKLGKKFDANGKKLIAVDQLSFSMYRDEIFVLLGHNGGTHI